MTKKQSSLPFVSRLGRARGLIAASALGLSLALVPALGGFDGASAGKLFNVAQPLGTQVESPSSLPLSFADIVKKVRPAVVSVNVKIEGPKVSSRGETRQFGDLPKDHPLNELFKRFFGTPGTPDPFTEPNERGGRGFPRPFGRAQGSGFIISEDGYVVTNNHVVDKATTVELTLDDGSKYEAEIVGKDNKTDLALLKIKENKTFPYVAFSGEDIEIGDWVVAVGNPFGLGGTVTAGIVSARGRDIGTGPYDDFIQIDASINKGNSGGPAFNLKGEVVGVNTAIFSPTGGSVGIGFAIPANIARDVITQLKSNGVVTRGWLGVEIQFVDKDIAESQGLANAEGAIVTRVMDNSPAAAGGVQTGDTIVSVNGETVEDAKDLARKIGDMQPNKVADLGVLRGGSRVTLNVKLGEQPAGDLATLRPDKDDEEPARSGETEMGSLGLTLAPASEVEGANGNGVVVVNVEPGSEAAEKGIQIGDVILRVHDRDVATPQDVIDGLKAAEGIGRKSALFRLRTGERIRFVALPANIS